MSCVTTTADLLQAISVNMLLYRLYQTQPGPRLMACLAIPLLTWLTWRLPGWCRNCRNCSKPTTNGRPAICIFLLACRANLWELLDEETGVREIYYCMPKLVSVIKLGLKVDGRVVPVVVKIHHVANDDSGEQVCKRHPATSETELDDTRVCNRAY